MKKNFLPLLIFGLILNCAYTQNKKEQIQALNYSIDSLKNLYSKTSSAYLDSLNDERSQSLIKQEVLNNKLKEIETLNLQYNSLLNKFKASSLECSDLKNDIEVLKNKQQIAQTDLQYFSIFVHRDVYNSIYTTCSNLCKYPEKSTLSRPTKSYSELKECYIWINDSVTYAFIIIKDTRLFSSGEKFQEGDNSLLSEQETFSCYLLIKKESDFIIVEKWESPLETCSLDVQQGGNIIDFQLTDINDDNKIEIWYVINSSCTLGIEPSKLDIYLFNNGIINKMASCANKRDFYTDDDIITEGNKELINKFDSNFNKLKVEYKSYAIELRNKHLYCNDY
jgi:hypothetical protein